MKAKMNHNLKMLLFPLVCLCMIVASVFMFFIGIFMVTVAIVGGVITTLKEIYYEE